MNKNMYIFLLLIISLLVVWSVGTYFFQKSVDSPKYTVSEKKAGYEIREYESYITAQVEVGGTYDKALNKGFRILADYIFGNNTKQTDITMTAPVTESESAFEKMAMTAPVIASESETLSMTAPVIESGDNQTRTISFIMPLEYTLETLPKPNNPEIKITQQDARKVAVLRFSWNRGSRRVEKKKQELLSLLERDEIESEKAPEYAGYDAPFTAPWLHRNEVMVEIK